MKLYEEVLQGVHPWTPSAPKIERSKADTEEEQILPPALIEQLPKEDPAELPSPNPEPWWLGDGTTPPPDRGDPAAPVPSEGGHEKELQIAEEVPAPSTSHDT